MADRILPFPKSRNRRPKPPAQITALDLDGPLLRIVQSAARGIGHAITRVTAAPLDLPADADRADAALMGRALRKALDSIDLRAGPVVMGIPRAQVVLRTLLLPVISDVPELAAMVHLQIARDLPFPITEGVIDFVVSRQITPPAPRAESPEGGALADTAPAPAKLEVSVAAVKREVVEFYRQTAAAAGLKLLALGFLPHANARCVEACQLGGGHDAFALVSLRPGEVNIDVIAGQTLHFTRGATIRPVPEPAPGESPDPESLAAAVTIEVVRSLHSHTGNDPRLPVAKIVVTGATGFEPAVVSALGSRSGLPCTQLDPVAALGLTGTDREHATGAIPAIGLALGIGDASGLPFDFLAPKRPPVLRDLRRIRILSSVTAAVAVLISVLTVRAHLVRQRTSTLESLTTELADAEKKRPVYRSLTQQAALITDWVQGKRDWLEHYAFLSAILPPSDEVYLNSLAVTGSGAIHLAVQARSGAVLAKLDKQLRAAGYEVKPLAITPGADRHGYEFRSNVELTVPAKLKIDLATVKPPARPADDSSLDKAANRRKGG